MFVFFFFPIRNSQSWFLVIAELPVCYCGQCILVNQKSQVWFFIKGDSVYTEWQKCWSSLERWVPGLSLEMLILFTLVQHAGHKHRKQKKSHICHIKSLLVYLLLLLHQIDDVPDIIKSSQTKMDQIDHDTIEREIVSTTAFSSAHASLDVLSTGYLYTVIIWSDLFQYRSHHAYFIITDVTSNLASPFTCLLKSCNISTCYFKSCITFTCPIKSCNISTCSFKFLQHQYLFLKSCVTSGYSFKFYMTSACSFKSCITTICSFKSCMTSTCSLISCITGICSVNSCVTGTCSFKSCLTGIC